MTKDERELFARVLAWIDNPQDAYPVKLVEAINDAFDADDIVNGGGKVLEDGAFRPGFLDPR